MNQNVFARFLILCPVVLQIIDMDTPSNSIVIQPSESRPWYEPESTTAPENIHSSVPDKVKAFPATADYIKKAKEAVEKMTATGGTKY